MSAGHLEEVSIDAAASGSAVLDDRAVTLTLALRRRCGRFAAAIVLCGLVGCQAAVMEGLPCGPEGECPDGQVCGTDQLCFYNPSSCSGSSCDAPEDEDPETPTPSVDTHGAVGTLTFSRGGDEKCIATLVASGAFLTTASCVAGGSSYRLSAAGSEVAVSTMITHPDYTGGQDDANDIAIGFLETPLGVSPAQLSSSAPERGAVLDAVVPMTATATDATRYQVEVVVEQVETQRYRFSSPAMDQPFACPTAGGPTFSRGSNVLVGLQSRSPCSVGAGFIDVRIDVFRTWIQETLAAQTPETCDGVASEPCAGCGMTSCDDSSGAAEITCVANAAQNPCDGGDTCDTSDASCDPPPAEEPECEHNGGYTFRNCGECGWEFCLSNGTWSGECGRRGNSQCSGSEECVAGPAGGGYSQTWVCEAAQPVTCNVTGGHSNNCPTYPSAPSGSVAEGTEWAAAYNCSGDPGGDCRWCECVDDGTGQGEIVCSSCYPHNL